MCGKYNTCRKSRRRYFKAQTSSKQCVLLLVQSERRTNLGSSIITSLNFWSLMRRSNITTDWRHGRYPMEETVYPLLEGRISNRNK
ncbi:hypothetical protein ACET3Z_014243 [Daucus carota]